MSYVIPGDDEVDFGFESLYSVPGNDSADFQLEISYLPPANDEVDFTLLSNYAIPEDDSVDFTLGTDPEKLGVMKVQTESGAVELPVYPVGSSKVGAREVIRMETGQGKGFIPVTDPSEAAYPELRIYTENYGIQAFHDSTT
jgi:hypothetical protein